MKSKSKQINAKRMRLDSLFSRFVTGFGLLVLATFLALIIHLVINSVPLFYSPSMTEQLSATRNTSQQQLGITQLRNNWISIAYQDCALFTQAILQNKQNPLSQQDFYRQRISIDCNKRPLALVGPSKEKLVTVNEDGLVEIFSLSLAQKTVNSTQSLEISLNLNASFNLPKEFLKSNFFERKTKPQDFKSESNTLNWKVSLADQQIFIVNTLTANSQLLLWHDIRRLESPQIKMLDNAEQVVPFLEHQQFLAINNKQLTLYSFNPFSPATPPDLELSNARYDRIQKSLKTSVIQRQIISSDARFVAAGPKSLLVFVITEKGELIKFNLANKDGVFLMQAMFNQVLYKSDNNPDLASLDYFINMDLPHNLLIIGDTYGNIHLLNLVTGALSEHLKIEQNILNLSYANLQLAIATEDSLKLLQVDDVQGLSSVELLFAKNQYAGYSEPGYVWQSSASSELQSPKYSVVPLIMGSLKASLLALIVAMPLALGAAIFTAYFAKAHIRNTIKPTIEMLEAIPSVIIGFIAAVWIAPFAEQFLLAVFAVFILLPVIVLIIAFIHAHIKPKLSNTKFSDWPFLINSILLLTAIIAVFSLSILVIDGPTLYLPSFLNDQVFSVTLSKTAIVVSLALGIAIAPTIYTLIDDALHEVPEGVKQAAFALGATEIQTLIKVVLVVALPSIISAIMLGFGRAFGETMIVLMVTGNTPIADWDLLSGLRTLTANLTIELQEARVDSTLFHILFLTASILFIFTFIINTIAALLKKRIAIKS